MQLDRRLKDCLLLRSNINDTRSDVAHLNPGSHGIRWRNRSSTFRPKEIPIARQAFTERVKSLMTDVPNLPNFSRFHETSGHSPRTKTKGIPGRGYYAAAGAAFRCDFIHLPDPGN